MKFTSDVDIDFADRSAVLKLVKYIPASIHSASDTTAHNTGIYVHEIPVDPLTGRAALDYRQAEDRGYIKLDFLNVHVYQQVQGPDHLDQLMQRTPPWAKLYDHKFCEQLIHIGRHHSTLLRMPEPVDSIPRLAMFLAVIRPAKRDLIGRTWREVAETIWDKNDDAYSFKRSHAVAYANLVAVHMNLLDLSNQGN